jgi:hypothetical protein
MTTKQLDAVAHLCDEQGSIPTFKPRALDEHGRLIPLTPEERRERRQAYERMKRAIEHLPDNDPPDVFEEGMRGIDAERPHHPLFKGRIEGDEDHPQSTSA